MVPAIWDRGRTKQACFLLPVKRHLAMASLKVALASLCAGFSFVELIFHGEKHSLFSLSSSTQLHESSFRF